MIDKINAEEVGHRINAMRGWKGYKQATLATEVGVSRTTVVEWEYGRHLPTPRHLYRIAKALGVSPAFLLGDEYFDEARLFGVDPPPGWDEARVLRPGDRPLREETEPYGDIPGARTVKVSDTRIPVLGSVSAGLTEPSRFLTRCPNCGHELEIELRRKEE